MTDEIPMFRCERCGREFDPDPDTMLELFADACGYCPSCHELAMLSEEELSDLGLTLESRDAILRGECVSIGGICICRECQDKIAEE